MCVLERASQIPQFFTGKLPMNDRAFIPLNIAVLTISDTRTEADDKSGKVLAEQLTEAGHILAQKTIVPDNIYRIRAAVSQWIAAEDIDVVISTGGTGVTGRDGTPEACSVPFPMTKSKPHPYNPAPWQAWPTVLIFSACRVPAAPARPVGSN